MGFPGDSVLKNLPANAGDMGLISGLGRSHMPRSKHHNYWACAREPRSCNYWAHAPQLLKPGCSRACTPQQEKTPQWEACARQLEISPCSNQDPAQSKIIFKKLIINEDATCRLWRRRKELWAMKWGQLQELGKRESRLSSRAWWHPSRTPGLRNHEIDGCCFKPLSL